MKNKSFPTILIVDDAPQNIQIAVEILKDKYMVSVATSGKKALSLLDEGLLPDLILLDIIMPEMNGFDVCSQLKNNIKYSQIPIIFLTILENNHDMVKGLELGAVDYVTKPFEPKVLRARVDTHIKLKMYSDDLINNIKEKDDILLKQSKLAILGEMFENITHQWKQPLSVISMISSTIKIEKENDVLDNDSLDNLLGKVDSSVSHLSDTIDYFCDFLSRNNSKEYFSMDKIIRNTLNLLESKIMYSNIKIVIDLDSTEIFNYKNDLIQVLMNIFANAIHVLSTKEDKKSINISCIKNDTFYTLIIKDNGGGIPIDIIEKVFDKYFSTKSDSGSSGLGLYMSKKIIEENMMGTLEVESSNTETLFKINLPI